MRMRIISWAIYDLQYIDYQKAEYRAQKWK